MPLQNFQYDIIMREYNRRQAESQRLLQEHREEIYRKIPRIQEIDAEVASVCASRARAMLQGNLSRIEDLKHMVSELSEERRILLISNRYSADYLEPSYVCPRCQDTGYIGNEKCSCFRKMEVDLLYAQSNVHKILQKENFDHFSFSYYSDKIADENTGLSALQIAKRAYTTAQNFVTDFDHEFTNLLICGGTGVGKTFLSHCIAKALIDSAHFVLYFSAYDLFDLMSKSAFSRSKEAEEQLPYIFDCDLLIIDDLGTELTNTFVSTQLFLCINERLMRQKSTVISTNLELARISDIYSERVLSRITSDYRPVRLIGNDIRTRKLF